MLKNKNRIIAIGLGVLSLAMVAIGLQNDMLPPILTGVGFGLLTWHLL